MPLAALLQTIRNRAANRIAAQWYRLDHEFEPQEAVEEPACPLASMTKVRSPTLRTSCQTARQP
jgi:hypothetical protein